jgi:hypothetical protein
MTKINVLNELKKIDEKTKTKDKEREKYGDRFIQKRDSQADRMIETDIC